MNPFDKRTASVLFTILVFVAVLAMAYAARGPIIAIVFAVMFSYLLDPLVTRFQQWLGGSRSGAIAATYVLLVLALAVFLVTAGPRIFKECQRLGEQLPALVENVGTGRIAQQIGSRRGWDAETQIRIQNFLSGHRDAIAQYSETLVTAVTKEIAGSALWLFLIPILAVFFLKGKSQFGELSLGLIPEARQRRFVRAVMVDLNVMLAAFIRVQLSFAALSIIAYTIFLLVIRFPYAFAIGTLAGSLEFIPLIGALITAAVVIGMAVLTGFPHWIVLVVFMLIWRGLQDYVSSPYLMGRGLMLHPLAVIFGVLCGGEIGGLPGVFLSVPIIAALRIVWRNGRLVMPRKRRGAIGRVGSGASAFRVSKG